MSALVRNRRGRSHIETKTVRAVSFVVKLSRFLRSHPLTRDAQISAWARFFSWQIRSRLQNEVIVPWIGGQRLAVRRGMKGATGNIYAGLHEFADMMVLLHFLRETDHFLDIGANIGSYTVLAAGLRHATVWAFEPDPVTALTLRRNIEINGLQERVVICEVALGDRDGEVMFTRGLDTGNRVAVAGEYNLRPVQVKRLDSLIGFHRPAMMKMDIEGYEEKAIRGAKALLADDSLKVIELETITPEVEATFECHGFKRMYYNPFNRELTMSHNDIDTSNVLYVRDRDFVASRLASAPAIEVLGRSI